MVDLKKFCGTDTWRTYLHEPFSRGEYTYASPSFFRFEGGDGALMPMRSEFENHVKVEVE